MQRTWAVLEEKQIPYQYIEVNPYHKPESLLELNPRGLVPTLQYDGKPLYESTVICEFLEDAYPQHGAKLLPEDIYERARMRIWSDYNTSRLIPSFQRFLQFQPSPGDETIDPHRDEFLGHVKEFTKEMDPHGPFFLGEEPKMIDFIVAPFLTRLWLFDHFKGGLGMPEPGKGGSDEQVWSRFRKWLDAISNRESIKNTLSHREHYIPLYQRYADNTAQSELAKATRGGRGVP